MSRYKNTFLHNRRYKPTRLHLIKQTYFLCAGDLCVNGSMAYTINYVSLSVFLAHTHCRCRYYAYSHKCESVTRGNYTETAVINSLCKLVKMPKSGQSGKQAQTHMYHAHSTHMVLALSHTHWHIHKSTEFQTNTHYIHTHTHTHTH